MKVLKTTRAKQVLADPAARKALVDALIRAGSNGQCESFDVRLKGGGTARVRPRIVPKALD